MLTADPSYWSTLL